VSGLLVVTAHPDDEVLIAGGTLAALDEIDVEAGVVCLTRGELGPIADPAITARATLPEARLAELRAACAELGVDFVKCYRRQDGNLRFSDQRGIARQLARQFTRREVEAVITFGEDGLYYHPDHVALAEIVNRAAAHLEHPPTVFRSIWPTSVMAAFALELRRRGLSDDLWGLRPEDFGTEDTDGAFALDLRPFAQRKMRALLAHRSQIGARHALRELDRELVERFFGFEWFARVSGPDCDWLRERLPASPAERRGL
jgi:N-acetylglucosamine malate deacetylase 2